VNIEFDIGVVALAVPRILARFSRRMLNSLTLSEKPLLCLKPSLKQHIMLSRGIGESENIDSNFLFDSLPFPNIVRALSPAIEACLHRATSALCGAEWSWSSSRSIRQLLSLFNRKLRTQ
jgi:hypothetical protein